MRKCILVDDDRWALVDIRASFPLEEYDFKIAAECLNAEDALEAIFHWKPELVITDVCMEAANGIDLIRICRQNRMDAQFIIVSGYDQFSFAQEAMNNGALYYLLKPISDSEARLALKRVVSVLETHADAPIDGTDSFQQALAYIQLHYSEQISLEEIAQRFGFNKTYFSELFAKKTGMGFAYYKNALRVQAAKKLMLSSMNVGEAGLQTGFSNVHYFSRVFKRITGESPNEWRNRYATNSCSEEDQK